MAVPDLPASQDRPTSPVPLPVLDLHQSCTCVRLRRAAIAFRLPSPAARLSRPIRPGLYELSLPISRLLGRQLVFRPIHTLLLRMLPIAAAFSHSSVVPERGTLSLSVLSLLHFASQNENRSAKISQLILTGR